MVYLFPVLIVLLIALFLILPAGILSRATLRPARAKGIFSVLTVFSFAAVVIVSVMVLAALPVPAHAQTAAAEAHTAEMKTAAPAAGGNGMLAMAIAVGLGSIGAGIAVGMAAASAIGAISENPRMFTSSLIFVAMAEGIAIYGLVIAILIFAKL